MSFSIAFARTGTILLVVREITPINKRIILESEFEFEFWCLMPLSAIFQLYHGNQF